MTTEVQITFDCADPAGLASFWAEALGYQVQPPPNGFESRDAALEVFGVPRHQWNSRSAILPIEGPHPRIFFQRVPEAKVVKNRVHLDVRAAPGLAFGTSNINQFQQVDELSRFCRVDCTLSRMDSINQLRIARHFGGHIYNLASSTDT